ncbi:hypothetical protein MBLNU230_g4390t1 [Neophaeotheca triangularis]
MVTRNNTRAPVGAPTGPSGKRRGGMGGKMRADRDGDVKMDAGVRGGAGVKKSGVVKGAGRQPGSTRAPRLAAHLAGSAAQREALKEAATQGTPVGERKGLVELKVTGWSKSKASDSQDGGVSSLVKWLEKKASTKLGSRARSVKIKKSRVEDDALIISIPSEDFGSIIRLNGYAWAGVNIEVKKLGRDQKDHKAETQNLKEMLKALLEARYNADTKLLDLTAFGKEEILKNKSVFDKQSSTEKFFPALMAVLEKSFEKDEEMYAAIESVSLSNNDLSDLNPVDKLSLTLPKLKNLDLSNNKLDKTGALIGWRKRFRHVQHLMLTGNPLEQNEPDYITTVMKWWPSLRMLNGVQVRTEEDVTNQAKPVLPFPVRSPAFQDEGGIAETFVRNLFAGFDADRPALAAMYYDEQSDFSYAVNTRAPTDPATDGQERTPWNDYIRDSRNLKKIQQLPARMKRRFVGTKAIADAWAHFPGTKHPDLASEARKWMIEAHIQPGVPNNDGQAVDGFCITVHGEFNETDKSTSQPTDKKRSFDRTFIIGPGGSSGVRVVSDMLVVRCFGGSDAFEPEDITGYDRTAEQQHQRGVSPPVPALPNGLTIEMAEQMCAELSKATNMTLFYSKECLEQVAWNPQRALEAFQGVKDQLPADAFQQPA